MRNSLRVETMAQYTIRVVGFLDQSWSDRLGGMDLLTSQVGENEGKPITVLTGSLFDQAALFGVLNALYDMRLPLLSVECIAILGSKPAGAP